MFGEAGQSWRQRANAKLTTKTEPEEEPKENPYALPEAKRCPLVNPNVGGLSW